MRSPDGHTVPTWKQLVSAPPQFPPPPGNVHADVCVVGAGIAGLMTAYLLAGEGKSVIVLDEGPIGAGQTERTSAHLASAIDDRFTQIERIHGRAGARTAYESHAAGIELIESVARQERIDCDFKRIDGLLFPAAEDGIKALDEELAAAKRAGFAGIERLDSITIAGRAKGPCLRFPNQARFHPLKFLYGLADAASRRGVKIYVGCRVKDVQGTDEKNKQPARAQLDDGPAAITAGAIVVATNSPAPINDWMGIYTKQSSYRTHLIAAKVPRGAFEDVLWWDDEDPYHYVRLEAAPAGTLGREDHDLLLIGGEDHKVGQFPPNAAPFARLESWARERFPIVGEVVGQWSGQVQEPSDYVAFIGLSPHAKPNVYVITGDSGMGLTHGALGARLVSDLILGRANPWTSLYDPKRKTLDADFVKENVNVVKQYADWISGGDVKSEADIPRGEGAVLREGLTKAAVYRDEAGRLYKCSATCTHLACVVQWNSVEKSWDCPCHGSRFDPMGKVLMGPAIDDLKKLECEARRGQLRVPPAPAQ
jgi:glycine/D-amino acid oxidase-like deaminating enzyme/nitrite reductase/ring-hydroxylating ferredoxin subunit